jgi:hypothetical protein
MTAKIKLNAASGGGSFSLQAPSSSANNRVMTLPDTADGTILTTTNPKSGNSLNQVMGQTSSRASTTSSSFSATNLNATITPTSSSNKVHIAVSGDFLAQAGSTEGAISIYRGSSNLGNASFGFLYVQVGTGEGAGCFSMDFLDSPNTTSATTYTVYFKRNSGSGGFYIPRNDGHNESIMILTEIAG